MQLPRALQDILLVMAVGVVAFPLVDPYLQQYGRLLPVLLGMLFLVNASFPVIRSLRAASPGLTLDETLTTAGLLLAGFGQLLWAYLGTASFAPLMAILVAGTLLILAGAAERWRSKTRRVGAPRH